MPTIVKSAQDGTIVHRSNYQPNDFYQESVDEKSLSMHSDAGDLTGWKWPGCYSWKTKKLQVNLLMSWVILLPSILVWLSKRSLAFLPVR